MYFDRRCDTESIVGLRVVDLLGSAALPMSSKLFMFPVPVFLDIPSSKEVSHRNESAGSVQSMGARLFRVNRSECLSLWVERRVEQSCDVGSNLLLRPW